MHRHALVSAKFGRGSAHPAKLCTSTQRRQLLATPRRCTAHDSLKEQIQKWIDLDTDAESLREVQRLQAEGDEDFLREVFGSRLSFGTAGLRALDGPGFNRMNTVTVKQTTQGLVRYLEKQQDEGWDLRCGTESLNLLSPGAEYLKNGIVVGYDARTYSRECTNSEFLGPLLGAARGTQNIWYAAAVVDTITSQNIPCHVFADIVPTPLVAHAVSEMQCAAGIMITASHNPAGYNGYKVYYCNGCQIIPPHDVGIAAMIEAHLDIWPEATEAQFSEHSHEVKAEVVESYYAYLKENLCFKFEQNRKTPPCVYTPLHGVGTQYIYRAFQCMGLPSPLIVPDQAYPDPEFPTAPFPNPEEGEFHGARLALANDPDADRLAASEWQPGETEGTGQWYAFTGNEIGILLASWLWEQKYKDRDNVVMLTTVVSSRMLAAMAAKEGFKTKETLTGFKWLGNWSNRFALEGACVPFAFEEAIGFSLGEMIRDKDGISAAAVFNEMAQECYRKESSVLERLQELQSRYGAFHCIGGYVIAKDPNVMQTIFDDIRGPDSSSYPDNIAGLKVESVRDLGTGLDTSQPDSKATLPWKKGDKFIAFGLGGSARLTLRASGTEPKLKYYLEVQGEDKAAAAKLAEQIEAAVLATLLQPEKYGLTSSLT